MISTAKFQQTDVQISKKRSEFKIFCCLASGIQVSVTVFGEHASFQLFQSEHLIQHILQVLKHIILSKSLLHPAGVEIQEYKYSVRGKV